MRVCLTPKCVHNSSAAQLHSYVCIYRHMDTHTHTRCMLTGMEGGREPEWLDLLARAQLEKILWGPKFYCQQIGCWGNPRAALS